MLVVAVVSGCQGDIIPVSTKQCAWRRNRFEGIRGLGRKAAPDAYPPSFVVDYDSLRGHQADPTTENGVSSQERVPALILTSTRVLGTVFSTASVSIPLADAQR